MTLPNDIVYGEVGESLVFIPRKQAEEIAAVFEALNTASTWGELRQAVTPERWQELLEKVTDDGNEPEPQDAAPFSTNDVPGFDDGDWPEWPAQEMLEWMPKAIVDEYGSVEDSVFNGPFLVIGPEREDEVVAALRAEGCPCEEDSALVGEASGGI